MLKPREDMDTATEDMIRLYQDLNGDEVDELPSEPSALEFLRQVARNRPFVVRGAVNAWPAMSKWSPSYLVRILQESSIKVAITPRGNADAPAYSSRDGVTYFVKPLEKEVLFPEFLQQLRGRPTTLQSVDENANEVWYAQTQNDNLRGEYAVLLPDVRSFPWARIALQQEPDAINLWIGDDRSVTALHRDNYENIYCQVIGRKHFVLIPPTEVSCIKEVLLDQAIYERDERGEWTIVKEDVGKIPCATWDPDQVGKEPDTSDSGCGQLCKPIRVSLDPGDILYLPALWYHKVSQSIGDEGICVAVNYWYDMDFSGPLYATSNYFRDVALAKNH